MWHEHLAWIADAGFRAVAVDVPGFGEAPVAPGPQAPWEDVLQTLRSLGADQAVVVGNSFGGAVALRMAVVAPAAVSKLMLVSAPPLDLDPSPALQAAWEAEESALHRGDIDAAVAAVVEAWVQPGAPEALRDRIAAMQRRSFELQAEAVEVAEAPDPLEESPGLVKRLEMPVMTVVGEADMPDFKHAAQDIAEAVRHGEMKVVRDAGHLAPLETPDRFKELLLGFLRS